MATLEKIRKRSVLLLIVIAVALLAFILGDALTNGRNLFGSGTTVAKVGSEKIDIQEFQRKQEELNQQLEQARRQNPQQVANFDVQTIPQMALNQLIQERLLSEAVSRMDIKTSPAMLRFYMLESPQMMPELQNIIRSLQEQGLNVQSAQQAYEMIFQPKRYNLTDAQMAPYQRQWIAVENEYKKQIAQMTYQRLLMGTVQANALDKKGLYDDYIATSDVTMAFQPFGQLDEKKYPVSDADIQKAYREDRSKYKVDEPTKSVSFISVAVTPSQADRAAAAELSQKTAAALRAGGQLSKDLKKEGLSPVRRELRASNVTNQAMLAFLNSAPADSVSIVESNLQGFKVVKMGKRSSEVDSIQVRMVAVVGKKLPAKVLASLNSGLSADSLTTKYSADSVMAQPAQWQEIYTAEGRVQEIRQETLDSLLNNQGRYITLRSDDEGSVLASVVSKSSPKEIFEFEEVDYAIQPSAKTLNDAREKLEKFLAANPSANAFKANAPKEGYNVQEYELTQSTPAVPRMPGYMGAFFPDSRQVVRWVMIDGKKGQVSHIYESKDNAAPMLYAAAVNEEYDDFIPVTNADVREELTQKVRRQKAGEALVKEYGKKGNIQAVANAMGVEPREVPNFRFGRGMADPVVTGTVTGTKPSGKMLLLSGDDGVYAFVIKSNGKEDFKYDDANYAQQFMRIVNPDMVKMLQGKDKIVNNSYKFQGGD